MVFGPLAPTDEFGNAYPEPLLKSLLGKPNVIHVKDNLATVGNSVVKRAGYTKLLKPIIKPGGYAFDAKGLPVEYIVRCLPKQQCYLIYLGNWSSDKVARPVFSLPALAGKSKVEVYSSASKTLSETVVSSLSRLAVDLAPTEVKLIHICKVK